MLKLKNILKRTRAQIQVFIEGLQEKTEIVKNKGNPFTVQEQMLIFKSVMDEKSMPKTFEEFKDICEKTKLSIVPLKQKLNRTEYSISTNWHGFIQPTIYAYLCHKSHFQWKKDLYQFVVDSKALSIADVDWKEALKRWPYCTRKGIFFPKAIFSSNLIKFLNLLL